MSTYFVIAVIVLVFVVIFQISKASEYVSILKGEESSRKQNNKINGFLMLAFLIFYEKPYFTFTESFPIICSIWSNNSGDGFTLYLSVNASSL